MGIITPKQSELIARSIGKELRPLWKTQVFAQADETAQYLITQAIARALVNLQKQEDNSVK